MQDFVHCPLIGNEHVLRELSSAFRPSPRTEDEELENVYCI